MHEAGDGDDDGTVVVAVMRAGYVWNGHVVRPAMVKVRG
jgi:molecular chaperone GrpE (heat shock protein)